MAHATLLIRRACAARCAVTVHAEYVSLCMARHWALLALSTKRSEL